MIQLFLDGKTAIPGSNASIKLTTENVYFTKSASYTYDIELPLDIAENRTIFGWCQRMDVEKKPRTLEACLIVDNVTVLTGTAHITSIDSKAVKVQLLGESSSYNYGNKMEDTYIDELDLGDWYMTTWPDGSYWGLRPGADGGGLGWHYYPEGTRFTGTSGSVFGRASYNAAGEASGDIQMTNLFSGEYPWVAFPVNNSSADTVCNGYCYQFTDASWNTVRLYFRGYVGERSGERPSENPVVASGAIQPYIWIMAEKIAAATGFTLDREDNALFTDGFFNKIFIVNTNTYVECNKCLPHWSVNEWWTQIENTFGVVMSIDYPARKMRLDLRKDFYLSKAKTIRIADVIDEYSSQVDDESTADISSNNVGFAEFDAAPDDLLSDFIRNNARINTDFNSLSGLRAWVKEQSASALDSYKDVIFEVDGRRMIYRPDEGLVEVDMFRPRCVDERKGIEVELKFVPARFIEDRCDIYGYYDRQAGSGVNKQAPVGSFPAKILEAPGMSDMTWYKHYRSSELDIAAIIDGEQEETDATSDIPDVIYMAIADFSNLYDYYREVVPLSNGGSFSDIVNFFKHPRAKLRQRAVVSLDGSSEVIQDSTYDLTLTPNELKNNLARHTINDAVKVQAKIRYCIKFVADRIPDTTSIFLIRNKRFVCEKIETDISPSGLSRLMTGYFYEFDL